MLMQLLGVFSPSTLLVFLAVFLLSVWYIRRDRNLPPGPWSLPLVGSIPFIGRHLSKEVIRFSKQYGSDVIRIQLGPVTGIFLNSYDVIKEGLGSDLAVDRPKDIFFRKFIQQNTGIASTDGPLWREHRRHTLSVLRDSGMGKMASETKILDEVEELVDAIRKMSEEFDVAPLLKISTANVICSIVFGQRYSHTDKDFLAHTSKIEENMRIMGNTNPVTLMPSLRHLPGDYFQAKKVLNNAKIVYKFIEKEIQDHKDRFDPNNIQDFLDAYIDEKLRQDARDPNNTYTDLQIKNVVADLFVAGTETSATTITWGLLYLSANQHIQQKVQKEIDDVIGQDRLPTMADKRHLPYTEATIMEIHRLASVAPLGVPHANNSCDVTFRGYTIPKGAFVFPNLWAVHRDPNLWKDPEGFHPENFLDETGKLTIPDAWMPFSSGRRQCPGESLAKMEVFLFMTSLLQKFNFTLPEGASPDFEGIFAFTLSPAAFKICAKRRDD